MGGGLAGGGRVDLHRAGEPQTTQDLLLRNLGGLTSATCCNLVPAVWTCEASPLCWRREHKTVMPEVLPSLEAGAWFAGRLVGAWHHLGHGESRRLLRFMYFVQETGN